MKEEEGGAWGLAGYGLPLGGQTPLWERELDLYLRRISLPPPLSRSLSACFGVVPLPLQQQRGGVLSSSVGRIARRTGSRASKLLQDNLPREEEKNGLESRGCIFIRRLARILIALQ